MNFKNAIWHFRRTICNKIVLNWEKMPQKCMECFRLLFDHLAWIEHQFLSGIRDSRKVGSLWGMTRGVGRVSKSVHQSWLAKGLGLGLRCWGFKVVQEEIPWEEASNLQIRSVAFPAGIYDRGCLRGVMVKVIVVNKFELQLRYYVHFWTNTLGKGMNFLFSQLWVK